jgi:adenylate cyclase
LVAGDQVCSGCGTMCPPGGKFCSECGAALAVTPSIDAARKQVTVLFTDLTGFTAMSERLDPEDIQEITGEIFAAVSEVVARYEGSVESFAGDGALVLFGVPRSHEDDPVRAVRSAMEIHKRVASLSPRHEAKVGRPLSMHSGINSGLAVIGNRDPEAGTHGVVGDVVNVASRLSGQATSGEILVGVDSWLRSESHFEFEPLDPVSVKGKSEPIDVYKLLAVKGTPIKTHGRSGISADLVGRARELEQLHNAVDQVRGGQSAVISLCGEAGTDKSRLVGEFKAGLDLNTIQWHEGHAYGYTQNTPFSAVIDLLSRAFRIEEGDAAEVIRQKVESGLVQRLGGDREWIPYVGNLYALTYPETERVSPEFWKARLFEGLARTLGAFAGRAPTVICFEDLHWADPSSLELLRYLLDHIEAPCLFLCVYRLPFNFAVPREVEIRLEKLSAADTQQMLASLLKVEFPSELRAFIERKAEGNPF